MASTKESRCRVTVLLEPREKQWLFRRALAAYRQTGTRLSVSGLLRALVLAEMGKGLR